MIAGKTVTALLPMKAHSERVKAKNFRMIAGKPLFRWILDALLESESVDRVVINTDARSILAENGLNDQDDEGRVLVRDRREEICGDLVSMNLVLADDVQNVDSDIYVMTHTTNPLLRSATVDKMVARYASGAASGSIDSLFTVNQHQTRFYTKDAEPINHDPANLIRTQDLPPYYEENSVFYAFSAESFAATGARIGLRPELYVTPPLESVDIDEVADWFVAESLLQRVARGEELPGG
ncbi:acylneuraminate cytidylyltransferase family protein [Parvularcula maris]|uniref:Acylneuraminate cytidylyltransferase family protein n=1 Tax=Parvularcula maris TaxID=2965077 RepID=A0A9X2RHP6_9PROT|nr:acylneuraminate cytidylyltransferase family protein [Parvularcula maris]MCQ8185145.1 acylneuraminate cytidylyltransferase family protein [Parvularcula maris]